MEDREPSGKIEDDDAKPCAWPDWIRRTCWAIRQLPQSRRHSAATDLTAISLMRSIESETIEPPRVQSIPDHRLKGRFGLSLHWQHKNRRVSVEIFDGHRVEIHTQRGALPPRVRTFRSVLPTRFLRGSLGWMHTDLYSPGRYLEWCVDGE
ncbi:MAG: hypothetical protein P4L84_36040 [Isosphaeraceae bacterium]|nr:hypothetical protein [Isosphaeraceae bacterium]